MASSAELEHVRNVWEKMKGNSPIYDYLLSSVQIVAATKGTAKARLTLERRHTNSNGTIHGAVTATIVDNGPFRQCFGRRPCLEAVILLWSGGLAISSSGLEKTGASIDIHINYLGRAQVGDVIEVEATANKVGRSIAFTTIKIYKLAGGEPGAIVATASHTKYIQQVNVVQQ